MRHDRKNGAPGISIAVSVCFLLSGMCGLIYQVIWMRSLSLIFGHTTFAISTVITVFMGGLALGSFLLGRLADHRGRFASSLERFGLSPALFLYGALEFIIGLYCLITPALFKVVESLYLPWSSLPFLQLSILRCLLSVCVLIIPTFCMGGTLPLLSKFLITRESEVAKKLGFLYFINTMGAVFGTLLSGFFLIRACGITVTLQIAAATNILIGIFVYFLNKSLKAREDEEEQPEIHEKQNDDAEDSRLLPQKYVPLFLVIFAVTGFASMIYELAWTRAIALALGSSTYSFSTMLATFLFGIALGSILFSLLSSRMSFGFSTFGWIEVGVALTSIICIVLLGRLPIYFIQLFPVIRHSYLFIIATDFMLSFLIMLLPTTLMGFAFPLAGRLCTKKVDILGRSVGDVYAVNTIGCIAGSFITGFLMIPTIGVQKSLQLAVMINLIGGLTVLVASSRDLISKIVYLVLIFAGLFASSLIPAWNPVIMSSGSAIYAPLFSRGAAELDVTRKDYIKFHKDGISATVSVYDINGSLYLRVNGKTDASTGVDMTTQYLLGYLPCFYSRDPRDVYVIGLGSGITVRAVLDFQSVGSLECAEIEPAVIEAAGLFSESNGNISADRRLKITVADGRNGLLSAKGKYDVIVSEPSNIWISGVANLFSVEFYSICASRLKDEGMMCSWVPIYSMKAEDLKTVLKTFTAVFPHCTIWQGSQGDIILVGSKKPLVFNYSSYERIFAQNEQIRKHLQALGFSTPDTLLAQYIAGREEMMPLCSTALMNSDEMPILEYSAPLCLYLDSILDNQKGLMNFKKDLLPEMEASSGCVPSSDFYGRAAELLAKCSEPLSEKALDEGLKRYPDSVRLNSTRIERLIESRRLAQAEELMKGLIARNIAADIFLVRLGELYQSQGMKKKAVSCYQKAYQKNSSNLSCIVRMIRIYRDEGKLDRAISMLNDSEKLHKDSLQLALIRADLLVAMKKNEMAAELLEKMAEREPGSQEILRRLLALNEEKGDFRAVLNYAGKLHEMAPDDSHIRAILAKAMLHEGAPSQAAELIIDGLKRDPFNRELVELYCLLAEKR